MNATDTGLLVVDAQEKLLAVVPGSERIVWNIRRLLDAAELLGVPRAATEQYPEKLGPTPPELRKRLDQPAAKLAFSGAACCPSLAEWKADGRHRVLVCGIETHVCIAQTAFDLTADGWLVYVAVDAVGTRHAIDHRNGAAANGVGRHRAHHHRGGDVRVVPQSRARQSSNRSVPWQRKPVHDDDTRHQSIRRAGRCWGPGRAR